MLLQADGIETQEDTGFKKIYFLDVKKCPFYYTFGPFPSKFTRTMWTTFNSDGLKLKQTHTVLVSLSSFNLSLFIGIWIPVPGWSVQWMCPRCVQELAHSGTL